MAHWKKSFVAIWVMQFLAILGMSQFLPFLPLYVQQLGVSDPRHAANWSGLLMGVGFVCTGLMAPVWGHLGDRWGRKSMVLRALTGSGVALLLMAYAQSVYQLLVLRLFHGSFGGFVSATTALATTTVPDVHLGFALGALQSAIMAGTILGPLTGGFLMDHWGFRVMILSSMGFLALGALVLWGVLEDDAPEEFPVNPPRILDNIRYVLNSPELPLACAVQFLVQTAFMAPTPVLALFVQDLKPASMGAGASTGLVFGVMGVATMAGALFLGHMNYRWGTVPILKVCLAGAAVAYVPHATAHSVQELIFWRALLGFFAGGINPALQSLMAKGLPVNRRAGVLGVTFSVALFGNALGPLLGGWVASLAGVRGPFLLTAGLFFLAWLAARRLRPAPMKAA